MCASVFGPSLPAAAAAAAAAAARFLIVVLVEAVPCILYEPVHCIVF